MRRALAKLYDDSAPTKGGKSLGWPGTAPFAKRIGCSLQQAKQIRERCAAEGYLYVNPRRSVNSHKKLQQDDITVIRTQDQLRLKRRKYFTAGLGIEAEIIARWESVCQPKAAHDDDDIVMDDPVEQPVRPSCGISCCRSADNAQSGGDEIESLEDSSPQLAVAASPSAASAAGAARGGSALEPSASDDVRMGSLDESAVLLSPDEVQQGAAIAAVARQRDARLVSPSARRVNAAH